MYVHHLPGQHVATIICHLRIPLTAEPDGCDGIAAAMAAALFTRTRSLPARQFERHAVARGIICRPAAGRQGGPVITLSVPARLADALDLLRLALVLLGILGYAANIALYTAETSLLAWRPGRNRA